ncbi:MAG: hypothetical protein GTO51_08770 [Candidatus Latescibacteria bacterium]|nr:hypothetical protein [Candidatus Latescibacterota bacterium]NIM22045.1 hypothetical protein [Candidatus Latescibacterota bacterium]NIM66063.1 hypothetical protein [Candidatus Latescibacterota bacterium]NIO02471.1 hypothetical protein [Candidatus Latescibacterota bacterium]NIO29382.1 hypothetical protein [Candidatus Latescibacterota bacterium]
MKKLLFVFLILLLSTNDVPAQGGKIAVYADPAGAECDMIAPGLGLIIFYVVYTGTPEVQTIAFSAPMPACMSTAVWLEDYYDATYILPPGNSQDGIVLSHFSCEPAPTTVMSITYFASFPLPSCCYYTVLAHPEFPSGLIEASDCDGNTFFPTGLMSTINGNASCPRPILITVPTRETTWGKVKALFSE